MGLFDSPNEAPGRTDCNAKNLNSLRCTVAEKIKKNHQKWYFCWKITPFRGFFLIFSATVHLKDLMFFALQ